MKNRSLALFVIAAIGGSSCGDANRVPCHDRETCDQMADEYYRCFAYFSVGAALSEQLGSEEALNKYSDLAQRSLDHGVRISMQTRSKDSAVEYSRSRALPLFDPIFESIGMLGWSRSEILDTGFLVDKRDVLDQTYGKPCSVLLEKAVVANTNGTTHAHGQEITER